MCGILLYSNQAFDSIEELETLKRDIAARGPNHWGSVELDGFQFEASVLALRDPLTTQPLVSQDSSGKLDSLLCFNGQIYDLPQGTTQDTCYFGLQCRIGMSEILKLEGEFAFVFYNRVERRIYFGRDRLGRRSLLYKVTGAGELVISSVAGVSDGFLECQAHNMFYIYSLDTKTVETRRVHSNEFHVVRTVDTPTVMPELVLNLLKSAVQKRLVRLDVMEKDSIAVLYSGGIDCTIIAGLLDDLLPAGVTIDLLNVAFENKRTGTMWETPDRLLAHRSLKELEARRKSQQRFRLVEINVPYTRTLEHTDKVKRLMYPNATVMDLSIALAFYFAAEPQPFVDASSPILFSGLGADELFAGYSRHLGSSHDPERLAEELELDFSRLPYRNLGRDDRICASWGREVRYPFLDTNVIECAMKLPLSQKTDGVTTKIILRDIARILGFTAVCDEKKRAIQFGARSAKMDPGSGNLKGHNAL